jgi:hypothetical protein
VGRVTQIVTRDIRPGPWVREEMLAGDRSQSGMSDGRARIMVFPDEKAGHSTDCRPGQSNRLSAGWRAGLSIITPRSSQLSAATSCLTRDRSRKSQKALMIGARHRRDDDPGSSRAHRSLQLRLGRGPNGRPDGVRAGRGIDVDECPVAAQGQGVRHKRIPVMTPHAPMGNVRV